MPNMPSMPTIPGFEDIHNPFADPSNSGANPAGDDGPAFADDEDDVERLIQMNNEFLAGEGEDDINYGEFGKWLNKNLNDEAPVVEEYVHEVIDTFQWYTGEGEDNSGADGE